MAEVAGSAVEASPADQLPPGFAQLRRSSFDPLEISKWAQELKSAFEQQRSPAFHTQSVLQWSAALDLLFLAGKLNVVEHGVRHLFRAYPHFGYAQNANQFFNHLPAAGGRLLPFRDDATKEIQIVAHDSSATVILVFCDYFHRLGMPLPLMHRWLGRLNASLVYIRDFRRLFGLAGIRSVASDWSSTSTYFRELAKSLGATRIFCYGSSAGVLPALHYGLELRAEAVLAMGGPSDLGALHRDRLVPGIFARMRKAGLPVDINLAPLYEATTCAPRASIVYAAAHEVDRKQAASMQHLPNVTLCPIWDYAGHNVVIETIARGLFAQMLSTLVINEAR